MNELWIAVFNPCNAYSDGSLIIGVFDSEQAAQQAATEHLADGSGSNDTPDRFEERYRDTITIYSFTLNEVASSRATQVWV